VDSEGFRRGEEFRINLRFDCRREPHVPAPVVQADPALRDHPILTVRQGPDFLLEDRGGEALIALRAAAPRPRESPAASV
jgi:hypothetical protein